MFKWSVSGFLGLAVMVTIASASEPYLVEPMTCVGTIHGDTSRVHPSYHRIKMTFMSFLSKRRDGKWVNSLEVKNRYFKANESVPKDDRYNEGWYRGPLYYKFDGTRDLVYAKNLSGRNDRLVLMIKETQRASGRRVDTVMGDYYVTGSVAGDYSYRLECRAVVVTKVKNRVDVTTKYKER